MLQHILCLLCRFFLPVQYHNLHVGTLFQWPIQHPGCCWRASNRTERIIYFFLLFICLTVLLFILRLFFRPIIRDDAAPRRQVMLFVALKLRFTFHSLLSHHSLSSSWIAICSYTKQQQRCVFGEATGPTRSCFLHMAYYFA